MGIKIGVSWEKRPVLLSNHNNILSHNSSVLRLYCQLNIIRNKFVTYNTFEIAQILLLCNCSDTNSRQMLHGTPRAQLTIWNEIPNKEQTEIKFASLRGANYFLPGDSTRPFEVFNILFNIFYIDQCVFNLLNATYS